MYYIIVRLRFVGELYEVAGPYSTYKDAELDFDLMYDVYSASLTEGQHLAIVQK